MGKHDGYQMVAEDDPQWVRFWTVYPHRYAKKEARKAWAKMNPSPALVDQMLEALAWQAALWAKQGYGTPYPASWLNAERWTDERSSTSTPRTVTPWACPHVDHCSSRQHCENNLILGKKPLKRAEAV